MEKQQVDWLGALGGFFGVGIGTLAVQMWIDHRKKKAEDQARAAEKEANEKARVAELATRLELAALDAVESQRRWVQYAEQGTSGGLSFSQPFQFTTADHVNELLKLGVSNRIAAAIYQVQALNNDVLNQVRWAQSEYFQLHADGELLLGIPPVRVIDTFSRAVPFIRDHWPLACPAVETLIHAARDAGAKVENLQNDYNRYYTVYQSLEARGKLGSPEPKPMAKPVNAPIGPMMPGTPVPPTRPSSSV